MSQNLLGQLTSPYLLQHADNPVHWQPWSDDVFDQAKRDDKPILLSIGYAACHWCHVMAHESFEDQKTADVMNDLFINVKVDREEHPDVDAIYQKALTILGQQGGWPLTMFLTPSGQPFWGGTYFPKDEAYGRPSFTQVLNSIADIYDTQKEEVAQNVQAIADNLAAESEPKGDGSLTLPHIKTAVGYIIQSFDPVNGGLQGAPKFPQPVLMDFLWRTSWIKKDQKLADLIHLSLKKMCLGGIYDHVGGGFARYSTDEEWLAPHFEKMLYDNALLISLLTMVWRKHPSPLFKRTIEETIDWAFKEMKVESGDGFALASALDADSEGVEGKFYVWSEAEIDEILGDKAHGFKKAYDVSDYGNWEGHNILRRVTDFATQEGEDMLNACRQKLYEARNSRIRPGRDDKVLTDWNAMMVKALCEAGLVFDRKDWITAAQTIMTQITTLMMKGDVLHHSWCDGKHVSAAYLEDYANLSSATLALYEVTGLETYLDQAKDWVAHLDEHFWDGDLGGYNFASTQTVEGLDIQPKPIHDHATPSGNGIMANVLADLYHLTGQGAYKDKFNQLITAFGNANPNEIFGMAGLCTALIRFEKMETIAIIGERDKKDTKSLIHKASGYPSPQRKLLLADGQKPFSDGHTLAGKTMVEDKATAYVCRLGSCSAPVTDVDSLEDTLSQLPL
ncbi:thioredoxin domain-containing protein [Terasakiella sp. A23]|uniref:thioredoxin domain-containing protein n=1 Tax=Terasakiella sp. FCG-A23 TaxID=3080561 RepID=UPI0029555B64|nr:thioredoxin domain-containing protein [Terasakiella sp. A23]MDV7339876.1 thioredoxin domain-containing protein [Terasakiella sp. A23]